MAEKKVSTALMPVNCVNWSIMTTLSSRSAVNKSCWGYLDPRCITSRCQCVNPRYGSWPGSMPSTWRIPPPAAVGWCSIWPETVSRSAVTVSETSCGAWDYGRSTRSLAPRCLANHQSAFPAWLMSEPSQLQIRSGRQISPTSRSRKGFCTWWRSWISSPGMCSVGSYRTALTWTSAWRPWRCPWPVAASPRSSIPIRAVNSPHRPSFNDSRQRISRSAGQEGAVL